MRPEDPREIAHISLFGVELHGDVPHAADGLVGFFENVEFSAFDVTLQDIDLRQGMVVQDLSKRHRLRPGSPGREAVNAWKPPGVDIVFQKQRPAGRQVKRFRLDGNASLRAKDLRGQSQKQAPVGPEIHDRTGLRRRPERPQINVPAIHFPRSAESGRRVVSGQIRGHLVERNNNDATRQHEGNAPGHGSVDRSQGLPHEQGAAVEHDLRHVAPVVLCRQARPQLGQFEPKSGQLAEHLAPYSTGSPRSARVKKHIRASTPTDVKVRMFEPQPLCGRAIRFMPVLLPSMHSAPVSKSNTR